MPAMTGIFDDEASAGDLAVTGKQAFAGRRARTVHGASASRSALAHNYPAERHAVVQEIANAWQGVEALGTALPAPLVVDRAATTSALSEFATLAVDGYDRIFLQAACASGVTQIISDDGDFCGVPGITLFTCNRSVIDAARAPGKLVAR